MDVNSLPKTVTRQRRGCDLNAGPSVPESSALTTRLLWGWEHTYAKNGTGNGRSTRDNGNGNGYCFTCAKIPIGRLRHDGNGGGNGNELMGMGGNGNVASHFRTPLHPVSILTIATSKLLTHLLL